MQTQQPAISDTFRQAARSAKELVAKLVKKNNPSLDWIDDLREIQMEHVQASHEQSNRQCQSGCSACCMTVQVDVTPVEAIAVSDYLRSYLDTASFEKIRERLEKLVALKKSMAAKQIPARPLACGMLGADGTCQIYPARPVICSGVFSLDRDACDSAAESAQNGRFADSVPVDVHAIQATGGISGTLQRVLVDHGLDGNLYELNSAVLCSLEFADAFERFLAGEDLFSDAICTDAHSAPRKSLIPEPKFSRPKAAKFA